MATTFYQKKNNAKSTITNNPLASGGLSITLASSTGSRFPTTGNTWLATIWDAVTYPDPSDDPNMEVVLIDSRSTDTLTVNASGRGYAGTTGVSHATGSAIRLLIMKEHTDQYETAITALEGRGLLGYAQAVADQTGISTITDLTNLSVAVTVPSGGRYIKITGQILVTNPNTNGALHSLTIREGSTTLQLSQLQLFTGTGSPTCTLVATYVVAATAGAHTYKLSYAASAGTGDVIAASARPNFILVEAI